MDISWLWGRANVKFHHASSTLSLPLKKLDASATDTDRVDLAELVKSVTPPCKLSPFLPSGHLQTAQVVRMKADLPIRYKRRVFTSPHVSYPGTFAVDFVARGAPEKPGKAEFVENCPPGTVLFTEEEWQDYEMYDPDNQTPMVIVLHGLSGGSHEMYLKQTLMPLVCPDNPEVLRWDACVVNSRGCAYSKLSTPIMYNARATWDCRQIATWAREQWPNRPLFGMGFSLGANMMVDYVGEEGDLCPLDAAVVLSNPWDLLISHFKLMSTWLGREVYSATMGASMKKLYQRHEAIMQRNPKVNPDKMHNIKYLYEFDRALQAPVWGYPTETAYYRDASSVDILMNVKIPLLGINSEDDPVTPIEACPFSEVTQNPHAILCTTSMGGHLGWFEYGGGQWMVRPTAAFLRKLAEDVDLAALRAERPGKTSGLVTGLTGGPNFDAMRRRLEIPIHR